MLWMVRAKSSSSRKFARRIGRRARDRQQVVEPAREEVVDRPHELRLVDAERRCERGHGSTDGTRVRDRLGAGPFRREELQVPERDRVEQHADAPVRSELRRQALQDLDARIADRARRCSA